MMSDDGCACFLLDLYVIGLVKDINNGKIADEIEDYYQKVESAWEFFP